METSFAISTEPRRRGRPPGSKNKKTTAVYTEPVLRGGRAAPMSPNDGKTDYQKAGERRLMAQAQLAELELALALRKVISTDELGPALAARNGRIRARLRAIPTHWVAQYVDPSRLQQAEAALRAMIDEALAELSTGGLC